MVLTFRHYLLMILTVLGLMLIYQWLSNPLLVSVSGVGQVSVPATKAIISLTLTERGDSTDDALSKMQGRIDKVRDYMNQNGFDEIATTQPQVIPAVLVSPTLSGYQVRVSMGGSTQKIKDLAKITSDFYNMGAVVVSQPTLAVNDEASLDSQALDKALKAAEVQAKQIAKKKFKFIRVVDSIAQAQGALTSTSTSEKSGEGSDLVKSGNEFNITKAVTVTYRLW